MENDRSVNRKDPSTEALNACKSSMEEMKRQNSVQWPNSSSLYELLEEEDRSNQSPLKPDADESGTLSCKHEQSSDDRHEQKEREVTDSIQSIKNMTRACDDSKEIEKSRQRLKHIVKGQIFPQKQMLGSFDSKVSDEKDLSMEAVRKRSDPTGIRSKPPKLQTQRKISDEDVSISRVTGSLRKASIGRQDTGEYEASFKRLFQTKGSSTYSRASDRTWTSSPLASTEKPIKERMRESTATEQRPAAPDLVSTSVRPRMATGAIEAHELDPRQMRGEGHKGYSSIAVKTMVASQQRQQQRVRQRNPLQRQSTEPAFITVDVTTPPSRRRSLPLQTAREKDQRENEESSWLNAL